MGQVLCKSSSRVRLPLRAESGARLSAEKQHSSNFSRCSCGSWANCRQAGSAAAQQLGPEQS